MNNKDNHYSNKWTFIEQITQCNKGIKYFDRKKEHLITIAPDWGSDIPNYVYLPLGKNAITSVPDVAKKLSNILHTRVYVKKIYGEENKNYLLRKGLNETDLDENLAGDDKFPEILVDIDTIIKASKGIHTKINMRYFRRRIRKALAYIESGDWIVYERPLSFNIKNDFKDFVDRWSTDFANRSLKYYKDFNKTKAEVSSVYYPSFLDIIEKQTFCYLTYINDKPVAFTSAYAISSTCLAVNGSLSDTSFPGLIQYIFTQLAYKAKLSGYQQLNLGSNDYSSQDRYKSSMGMIDKIFPYIFYYDN